MANNKKIIALHNNDVVFLAWQYDAPIAKCLGFSVRRKDLKDGGGFKPLPAWVGWQGGDNKNWKAQTTDVWPVQKFSWRDFTAAPGGSYQYEVVPMTGTKDNLTALDALALTSAPVVLTPETANDIEAYFNNGILSTQSVAHYLPSSSSGAPSSGALLQHIRTPNDDLRKRLAGQMIDALKSLLERARTDNGQCYCAIYELDDDELVTELIKTKGKVHVVLSTAGTNDSTNHANRQKLHDSGIDITDRMLDSAHIGHNKFVVYADAMGMHKPCLREAPTGPALDFVRKATTRSSSATRKLPASTSSIGSASNAILRMPTASPTTCRPRISGMPIKNPMWKETPQSGFHRILKPSPSQKE